MIERCQSLNEAESDPLATADIALDTLAWKDVAKPSKVFLSRVHSLFVYLFLRCRLCSTMQKLEALRATLTINSCFINRIMTLFLSSNTNINNDCSFM